MRKKLLAIIALLASFALCVAMTACFGDGSSDESVPIAGESTGGSQSEGGSHSDGGRQSEDESQPEDVKITLGERSITVYEFEEYAIEWTVTGSVEVPSWTSSDENVATVNGGIIYGVSEGTAIVTARVGEAEVTVEVKVEETIYAPVLEVVSSIEIEKYGDYSGEVKTLWKGEEAENTAYEWTLAEGEADDVVSLTHEGGEFKFEGLKTGTTAYYVSTEYRGTKVNAKVSITVKAPVVTVLPSSDKLTPEADGYRLNLWTSEIGGDTETVISFSMSVGDKLTENVDITWDFEAEEYDEYVVKLEKTADGVYKATKQSAGNTVLTGTCVAGDETMTVKLYITVNKAVVTLDYNPTIEVERLSAISVPDGVNGEITAFMVGDTDVLDSVSGSDIILKKEMLPVSAKELGKGVETVIVTSDVDYKFTSTIYTLVIKTKEDLDSYPAIAKANGGYGVTGAMLDGYFVLGNDIDYNGRFESPTETDDIYVVNTNLKTGKAWNNSAFNGFKGIFDGNGYNIDGLQVGNSAKRLGASGGFIGYLHDEGVVRNISFTNAIVEENNGFICAVGGGLIENVSITYKQIGVGNATTNMDSSNPPRTMGSFFSFSARGEAKVKNCFVDASGAVVKYVYSEERKLSNLLLGTDANKKNVENLLIVADDQRYLTGSGASATALTYDGLGGDECGKIVAALPSDVWSVVGKIPMLKRAAEKIDTTLQVALDVADEVFAGTDVTIGVNEKYSMISVENLPEGVTLEGRTLKIDKSVAETTITVKVRSMINNSADEKTITIYPAGSEYILEERQIIDLKAIVTDGEIQSETDSFALDLSGVYKPSEARSAKVIIDGTEYVGEISADGVVTFGGLDIKKYGEYSVKVEIGRDVVNATAMIVTKSITTADEFIAIKSYAEAMNMDGYYMLGNDISVSELDAKTDQIGKKDSPFVGFIDGNGHKVTIWNFYDRTYANGSWIYEFRGVIKNISFELKSVAKFARFIYRGIGGTIENVYITLKSIAYGDGAVMFGNSCGKMNVKNVVVDMTAITSAGGYTIFGKGTADTNATFTSVVVKTNSAFADKIGLEKTDGVDAGIYVYYADTDSANGVAFPPDGWNENYWTVEDGNVTWKNA